MSRVLEIVSRENDKWLDLAQKCFQLNRDDAHEIVQGMYLKLHNYVKDVDKIMYNDTEVNSFYIYKVMHNLWRSTYHKTQTTGRTPKSKLETVSLEGIDLEYTETEYYEAFESRFSDIQSRVDSVVDTWYWYDRKIYKLHNEPNNETGKPMSMRAISKATNISLSSVFNTLKGCRERLKAELQDDYNKYKLELQDG